MGGSIGATQGSDGSPYRRPGVKSACHCNCDDCQCDCHFRHEEPKVSIWQRGKDMISRFINSGFFIVFAIIAGIVIFFAVLISVVSSAESREMSQPCSAYSNYPLGRMPARCIQQYSKQTIIVNKDQ